jgi:DNA polymerase I-like protein with 3'-5' exonuclease and polymerase domains
VLARQVSLSQVQKLLSFNDVDKLWAIDLETTSLRYWDPAERIVGIGFACDTHCFYLHLDAADAAVQGHVAEFLRRARRLSAFNVKFDAAWLWRFTGEWLSWTIDSFGLFKQLANEGYTGQKWNLETAQLTVLGWPDSNKDVLDAELKKHGLAKEDMSKLPAEVLGHYCAIDAEAAYQLADVLLDTCAEYGFEQLLQYHGREYMGELPLLIEAQARGIYIDMPKLQAYYQDLLVRTERAKQEFMEHAEVAPYIAEFEAALMAERLNNPPPQFTIKGEVTARYRKWSEGHEKFMQDNKFNINSKDSLSWLFYTKLGNKVQRVTESTGRPVVDKKILPMLGEPGRKLFEYNKLLKECGYVTAALAKAEEEGGVIRPDFSSVGTITGRLSGGSNE